MKIKDKIVLITGASSGIGEAVAHRLAARGARLILVARRENELLRVRNDIHKNFADAEVKIIAGDITNELDRQAIQKFVQQEFGYLNILINNAGITVHGNFEEFDMNALRKAFEINFFAMADLIRLHLSLMRQAPENRMLVYTSTPSALYGIPQRFAYSASKGAGNLLLESLRNELFKDDIRILLFSPGYVETALRKSGLTTSGKPLDEQQEKGAKNVGYVADKLIRGIEKEKRIVFTDKNGPAVYWLRTLFPSLLDYLIRRKANS